MAEFLKKEKIMALKLLKLTRLTQGQLKQNINLK